MECKRLIMTPDKKFCVPGDVEVFVWDKGWLAISYVRTDDRIMQLNPRTFVSNFGQVLEVHRFDHDGEMVRLLGPNIDLVTTLEHNHLVAVDEQNFQLKSASELIGDEIFYKVCNLSQIDELYLAKYPYGFIDANELAYVYGVFIATLKETEDARLIKFFASVRIMPTLEPWISGHAKSFIKGLTSCKNTRLYGEEMADDIQMIGLIAGVAIDLEHVGERGRRLVFGPACVYGSYNLDRVSFKGKVYCVTVPTHVFMARRNGKCVWTGCGHDYQFE